MKKIVLSTLALVLVAGLVSAQTSIKIATQSPLSGGQAAMGELVKLGAQIAIDEAKDRFKALGFTLELAAYDDQANPDTGVANANRIITDESILGVVGHLNSGVAIPSSEVYNRVGLTMVSPANTNPKVTDRNLLVANRVCGRDDVQGPAGAEFAIKELKAKKIFIINDKSAYGQGMADEFKKRAAELGVAVPNNAYVGTEEKSNFNPVITQILAYQPDLIYFGGMFDQIGPFTKQLRERGIKTPILGGDGLDVGDYEKLAGSKNATDTYYTTVAGPVSQFPKAAKFLDTYRKKYSKEPAGVAIYAYDCANVILSAIETAIKANSGKLPARDAVAKAVRAVKLDGLTGHIEFDTKGDIKVADYFIVRVAGTGNWDDNKVQKSISVPAPQLK